MKDKAAAQVNFYLKVTTADKYNKDIKLCLLYDLTFRKLKENRLSNTSYCEDHMILQEQIYQMILNSCPSFKAVFDSIEDKDLPYSVAGEFARHLMDLYNQKQVEDYPRIAQMIEAFLIEGDEYVKEFATIGILEDIQNIWGHNNIDPENFAVYLLPISKENWEYLNNFWQEVILSKKEN